MPRRGPVRAVRRSDVRKRPPATPPPQPLPTLAPAPALVSSNSQSHHPKPSPSPNLQPHQVSACSEGAIGPLCGSCDTTHIIDKAGTCKECASSNWCALHTPAHPCTPHIDTRCRAVTLASPNPLLRSHVQGCQHRPDAGRDHGLRHPRALRGLVR
eukprot:scaffold3697_cov55-Phaeocystis_antarctica.AAC.10